MNSDTFGIPSPLAIEEESEPKHERPLLSILVASGIFWAVYQIMPALWLDLSEIAKKSGVSSDVFNIIGFVGMSCIVLAVVSLKCDIFGVNNPDRDSRFLWMSTVGAFLHLLSFIHFYNPYGITLDSVFAVVGIVGLVRRRSMTEEDKRFVPSAKAPPIGRYLVTMAFCLVIFTVFARTLWPYMIKIFAPLPDEPFLKCGWAAGILILSSFLGQSLSWLNHTGKWYGPLHILGVVAYLVNLLLEYNPYTVALEVTLLLFFFAPIRSWVFFNPLRKV